MVKLAVKQSCCLESVSGFEQPKKATYTCNCGSQFAGLKLWREHMSAKAALRKCVPPPHRNIMERLAHAPHAKNDP